MATLDGGTGLEKQILTVEEALDALPQADCPVGGDPVAEAAISQLRARDGRDARTVSPHLYRGVSRGRAAVP